MEKFRQNQAQVVVQRLDSLPPPPSLNNRGQFTKLANQSVQSNPKIKENRRYTRSLLLKGHGQQYPLDNPLESWGFIILIQWTVIFHCYHYWTFEKLEWDFYKNLDEKRVKKQKCASQNLNLINTPKQKKKLLFRNLKITHIQHKFMRSRKLLFKLCPFCEQRRKINTLCLLYVYRVFGVKSKYVCIFF